VWTCSTSAAIERQGVFAAAVVTARFRMLAEFTLANTEKTPDHPMVVLEETFEYVDDAKLEEAARTTLEILFGPVTAGVGA
jgi:hypothetical protein